MDEKQRALREMLQTLGAIHGRHTELVSVYVPAGCSLQKVVDQIRNEQGTASNIKSKQVRKNVLAALEKILQHLKLYKQTPANGLAFFCGNVSEKEGQDRLEIWTVEPPEPIRTRLYWCGQEFILDPLKEIVREKEIYGLITVDKSDAQIALLRGKRIEMVKNLNSIVPGKTKAGGWCVHEDTLLQLAGGRTIPIKSIGEQTFVCYDFVRHHTSVARHNHIFSRVSTKALKISAGSPGQQIVVTPEHVFFVAHGDKITTKPAGDLRIGERLFAIDQAHAPLKRISITAIEHISNPQGSFYDMEILPFQNFLAGGFLVHNSQHRYERVRENLLNDFLKKVGEIASTTFKAQKDLKGVLIGGPGPIKEEFVKGNFLEYSIQQKVLGAVNTAYTGESGLEELVAGAAELLAEAAVMRERKLLDRFFEELGKDSGLAVYGLLPVRAALEAGQLELLIISEAFDGREVSFACPSGHTLTEQTVLRQEKSCPQCGAPMRRTTERQLAEELSRLAEQIGAAAAMVSTDTPKGGQLKELGGIAGILRYRL